MSKKFTFSVLFFDAIKNGDYSRLDMGGIRAVNRFLGMHGDPAGIVHAFRFGECALTGEQGRVFECRFL